MLKFVEPVQQVGRLVFKRQKILSAFYHKNSYLNKENKSLITTEKAKLEIVEKKTDSSIGRPKYEPNVDIEKPPPLDEEFPVNPRDPNTRVDMRPLQKQYKVLPNVKLYSQRSELIFKSLEGRPKDLNTFKLACNIYLEKEGLYRRWHVEFIETAVSKLPEYNLQNDINAYRTIMDVFPKEVLKPRSLIETEMKRYPKQQDCAIQVLDKMERNGVIPDVQFCGLVKSIFSSNSHVYRKLQRMMYWLPKFKYANPWYIPRDLPNDAIELAKMALKRMAFDINNELTVWKTTDMEENPTEDTFIVSAQSPEQRELIQKLSPKKAVFVNGGYNVYLRNAQQTYFVLQGESSEVEVKKTQEEEEEDLFEFTTIFEEENPTSLVPKKTVHEQEDGVILGMCITGTSTKDSLVSWIRYLQESNPHLEQIPVVFTLRTEGQSTDVEEVKRQAT